MRILAFSIMAVLPALTTCSDDGSTGYSKQAFACHQEAKRQINGIFDTEFVRTDITESDPLSAVYDVVKFGVRDKFDAVQLAKDEGLDNFLYETDLDKRYAYYDDEKMVKLSRAMGSKVAYAAKVDVEARTNGRRQKFLLHCVITKSGRILLERRT